MTRPRNTLLLTATITPMAKANVTRRADPALRRADYEQALRFYLGLPGGLVDGILFCENSGADLTSLERIAAEENPRGIPVTFFGAMADCPPEYGKGHSELQLMDRAFAAHIAGEPENHRFWKLTGRMRIANIERLIATAPGTFALYLDLRLVPGWLRRFGTDRWADTRIVGFTPEGYRRHLLDRRGIVGTPGHSHIVELALFPELHAAWQRGEGVVPRFAIQPVMLGVGAESLKDYNDLPSRAKNALRRVSRRVAPSLWL